jgi:hypothetical protein
MLTVVSYRSSYSGTNYDRWSYEQAAKGGTLADTPINRLQHKFWVARQVPLKYSPIRQTSTLFFADHSTNKPNRMKEI